MRAPTSHFLTLAAGPHAAWRLLLALLIAAATLFCLWGLLRGVVQHAPLALDDGGMPWRRIALLLTAVMLLLPAVWAGARWGLGLRLGWQSSLQGRMRWGWLALAWGISALCLLPAIVGDSVLNEDLRISPQPDWRQLLLIAALLIPLQAAAEEFAFRGLLLQGLCSVMTARSGAALTRQQFALAAVVTSLLFAYVHGVQSMPLLLNRLLMGLILAWLVWRTQGLEAAIALHMANNQLALLQSTLHGNVLQSLTSETAHMSTVLLQATAVILAAWWMAAHYQRKVGIR